MDCKDLTITQVETTKGQLKIGDTIKIAHSGGWGTWAGAREWTILGFAFMVEPDFEAEEFCPMCRATRVCDSCFESAEWSGTERDLLITIEHQSGGNRHTHVMDII